MVNQPSGYTASSANIGGVPIAALKAAVAVPTIALFAVPQFAMWWTQAGFLVVANESIAYRFFLALRLSNGEGETAWLPQGQLTSLLQRLVYAFVSLKDADAVIWAGMDQFGLLYGWAVTLFLAAILIWIVFDQVFSWRDTLLIAVTPLAMMYLLAANLNYTTQADYHHLNMVLFTLAVVIFVRFNCSGNGSLRPRQAAALGILGGMCFANKASIVLISVAAAAPVIAEFIARPRLRSLATLSLAAIVAAVTATVILLALYDFRWSVARAVAMQAVSFAANPGEVEPSFLRQLLGFAWSAHYLQAVIAACLAFAAAVWCRGWQRSWCIMSVLAMVGMAFIVLIWHRPAGSTAFDAACSMVALAAMLLAATPEHAFGHRAVAFLAAALAMLGWANFRPDFLSWLESSRKAQDIRIQLLQQVEALAHPIIAVIPDDRWAEKGPLPAILKGLADVPSWTIAPQRQRLIPLATPLVFRTNHSLERPDHSYAPHAAIMWEDPPSLPALADQYPTLREAVANRRCLSIEADARLWLCLPRIPG